MEVIFSPEAREDLIRIYDYIADQASPQVALGYIERIEAACLSLASAPLRGTKRDEVRPGLRSFGFERRVTIAFHVEPNAAIVDRILYGGRDLAGAFEGD